MSSGLFLAYICINQAMLDLSVCAHTYIHTYSLSPSVVVLNGTFTDKTRHTAKGLKGIFDLNLD